MICLFSEREPFLRLVCSQEKFYPMEFLGEVEV